MEKRRKSKRECKNEGEEMRKGRERSEGNGEEGES